MFVSLLHSEQHLTEAEQPVGRGEGRTRTSSESHYQPMSSTVCCLFISSLSNCSSLLCLSTSIIVVFHCNSHTRVPELQKAVSEEALVKAVQEKKNSENKLLALQQEMQVRRKEED